MNSSTKLQELQIDVGGMTCASCSARVERALQKLPGVVSATVNLATERAELRFDPSQLTPAQAVGTIHEIGYAPVVNELNLAIEGMTCASCVGRVERALKRTPGVLEASVNLATERAHLRYLPAMTDPTSLAAGVVDAGYAAHPLSDTGIDEGTQRHSTIRSMRRDVIVAAVLALVILGLSMGDTFVPSLHRAFQSTSPFPHFWDWVQGLLASVVLFGPGLRFFRPGWIAYRHLSPDMNSLVATGTGAAWAYSVLVLITPELLPAAARHVYFDSAAVVIAAVLFGKYLE